MPGLLGLLPIRASESMPYLCSVHFLDLSDPISVTYHRNTKGSFLLEHVSNSIDVTEADYFGLKYLDNNKLECWLDPTKSIYTQLKGVSNPVFHYRVKFYPSDPDTVKDDVTRYQLYLQAYKDFEEGRLICSLRDALVLSAYVVQGELGDFTSAGNTSSLTTSTPTSHSITTSTPKPSRSQGVDYVSETRVPETMKTFQEDIMLLHSKLKGMKQNTCERNFLRKASSLNSYGMHPYVVADLKGNNLYLTLTPSGIVVFEENIATSQLKWQDVKKTSFDGKLFYIKSFEPRPEHSASVEKENSLKTSTVAYRCASSKACKQLWKNSVAHKLFFTLTSSDEAPKVLHSGGRLSRGAKFRYSGRCLTEMNQATASTPKDETKSVGDPAHKKCSMGSVKYATLPKGGDKMNTSILTDDVYDASEDEQSLLNKTATSIVLNYLSTNTESDSPPRRSIRRSITINHPKPSVSAGSAEVIEDNSARGEGAEDEPGGSHSAANDTARQHNSLPASSSTTPTQSRSFSANFSHTTKAIAAATSRLKKFIIHNTSRKSEPKKESKEMVKENRCSSHDEDAPINLSEDRNLKEEEVQKRKSIFEDGNLSHGVTPTILSPILSQSSADSTVSSASFTNTPINLSPHPPVSIFSHSPPKPPKCPSSLPLNSMQKHDFIRKLRENDEAAHKNLPTTLSTSTIVTTIQATHSSVYHNNFEPKNNNNQKIYTNESVEKNYNNNNSNYFNKNFNYVDETIKKTERITGKGAPKKESSIDSHRNVVHDDTGYLSGSDAFNQSFEGHKSSNLRKLSNNNDGKEIILEGSKGEECLLTSSNCTEETPNKGAGSEKKRQELMELLTYESSLMNSRVSSDQCNYNEASNKENKNVYYTQNNLMVETEKFETEKAVKDDIKTPSVEELFSNGQDTPALSDFSPSSLSSDTTTSASTVTTPAALEADASQPTSISSMVEQAAPDVISMGVLSDDNFERIKAIRKLLQENKEKIQEIRENIDSEIRTFAENSVKTELPANYKFCFEDTVYETGLDEGGCGESENDGNKQRRHSLEEKYSRIEIEKDHDGGMLEIDNEDEKDFEDTIFIDRNYNTGALHRDGNSEDKSNGASQKVSKPKHIAFSTKHYEWYGENGVSSGGGGVIYAFCGGPVSMGEIKYPSDCGLLKASPSQEEHPCLSDTEKEEAGSVRKASIGRSISSIEGIYSADNVHHYNRFFDKDEIISEGLVNSFFHKDLTEGVIDAEIGERVVIGGRDAMESFENKDSNDDAFISAKMQELTAQNVSLTERKAAMIQKELPSKNDVYFSDMANKDLHAGGESPTCKPSALQKDVVTFEALLQQAEEHFEKPFCKILTTNPKAAKIKSEFDDLNAQSVSGTLSTRNFASDLDTLDAPGVTEDLIIPEISPLLYQNTYKNVDTQLDNSTPIFESSSNFKEENENPSKTNETNIASDEKKVPQNVGWNKKKCKSCMGTLLTSSIIAIALFSVAMVILFETDKDKEYFSDFGALSHFRDSFYDPCRHYVVCSIRKHLPRDFFGLD